MPAERSTGRPDALKADVTLLFFRRSDRTSSADHWRRGLLVDAQLKDIWPRIVPHHVQIELAARNIIQSKISRQNTFAFIIGASENLPQRANNAAPATRNHCLWVVAKLRSSVIIG